MYQGSHVQAAHYGQQSFRVAKADGRNGRAAMSILPNDYPTDGLLEFVEKPLSADQLFRLIEIAYETHDTTIKDAALKLVRKSINPKMVFRPVDSNG
jgi:hypothetical protein